MRRCLLYCQEASHKISGRKRNTLGNGAERLLENLVDWLRLATIDDLVKAGLHESLTIALEEGLDARFARHRANRCLCQAGARVPGKPIWPARRAM